MMHHFIRTKLASYTIRCNFNQSSNAISKISSLGTTVPLYEFAAKQQKKEYKLGVKKFSLKISASREVPEKSTETWKVLKHKKTIQPQKSHGKERLEDYSTSVV